ncbi:SCO family protein [Quisquiliibacterium transsilvanicum]|jgi:protein SCO1/2|uniref:Protein SCO1/2 n=1 Tax=Quisquiliibacterium transsilvanicum TaxID=1549638 RepID=A0A7W8M9Z3_9BURK|nr:SCO family protein [Quisquiliibacterium transsilvanicum]MBB5273147.1 protein SCO1/2 [Quisquiliibacterium transsilvanicum]
MRRRLMLLAPALAALWLTGCDSDKPAFRNTDVTGADFGKGFELTDHNGQRRTLADYRGKVVTIFFGYTHCPDVCPTTLSEMAEVMRLLGDKAERVQALFVTVDPERDTQELLASYVPAFDRRFVGLYGDPESTAKVAKEFKVFYQKVPGSAPGIYTVDHSAGSFAFDAKGRVRLFIKHGQGAEPLAQDLERLIDEG